MSVDETMLRAYVDGELDPATREQLEHVLAHSPALQDQVAALQASCLPYQAAFEAQPLPALPARLAQRVADMAAVAAAPARLSSVPMQTTQGGRRQLLGLGFAAAASFAAGLAVPWRGLFGPSTPADGRAEAPSNVADATPWVRAIASYHALYVRETLDQPGDAPARLATLLTGFTAAQRAQIFVPDLLAEGLVFKRVQRLGFEGRPLIQMVYLPASAGPSALCLLPTTRGAGADRPVSAQSLHGLGVASWARAGLAYVLVADMAPGAAQGLAGRLLDGGFGRA